MKSKRTYYGYTTYQQRKLLFETWEKTGKITSACQKAHVSRGLFYYWKAQFDEKGYAGLEEFDSREAHKLNKKDESIEQKVIELRRAHGDWGKRCIAEEMAKANNWEPIVSANTVRRILDTAGLWPESGAGKKEAPKVVVRVAEQTGQTINIDLLFVPEQYTVEERLPAVSGSSGHLVVGRTTGEKEQPSWPGMVFANNALSYEEAMNQYIAETRDRLEHRKRVKETSEEVDSAWREEWQARSERYQVRKQREQQDTDWKTAKSEWQTTSLTFRAKSREERKVQRSVYNHWC